MWWLIGPDGARRRVDAAGILVGRSPRCDVVLRDPRASRSQALVYLDGDRPRLLVLGKGRTQLNGARAERETSLSAGDRIGLPGLELELSSSIEASITLDGQGWVLDRPGGGLFGISHSPFTVGGHASDDLLLVDWPAQAMTLHLTQGRLHASAHVALEIDGVAVEKEDIAPLSPGSQVVFAGQTLKVIAGGQFGQGSTLLTADSGGERPDRVELEFLPRGGRLRVHSSAGEACVYLPGARCDLMALLLRPPEPHEPGAILEDDLLISRVWPNQARTRIDLNTLVYRLRRDLVAAGIDASSFILRAPGGGGTGLGLTRDVAISVR